MSYYMDSVSSSYVRQTVKWRSLDQMMCYQLCTHVQSLAQGKLVKTIVNLCVPDIADLMVLP